QRHDDQVIVVSKISGVRKWIQQHAAELVINSRVRLAPFLNLLKIEIEHINESISESRIPTLVISLSRIFYVAKDRREKTDCAHPRRAFIFSWNCSTVNAESGDLRKAAHRSSSTSFSS